LESTVKHLATHTLVLFKLPHHVIVDTALFSLPAARLAGITPDTPGVQPAGTMRAIGPNATKLWIAPITSFEIGGEEESQHARLLIGDLKGDDFDMLLGADFFLANRIYIANGERKLYFTYNGGLVFGLGGN